MLKKLFPREEKFFVLFQEVSDLIMKGAREFREMIADPTQIEMYARKIKETEQAADEVTHKTVALLHQTFITPLDRGDIHELITTLDDILDNIESASQRMYLYGIKKIMPHTIELADIIIKSVEHVQSAVRLLENLKNPAKILEHCVQVNHLENDADHVMRKAMVELFQNEADAKEVIKWKEIYEMLESVTDRCEDVSNIVESIVLEYA
ncbi:MAG: DUF47 family protein [Pseudomonadota bacterium]